MPNVEIQYEVCTYFLQSKSGGPIKIGMTSSDPRSRSKQLETGTHETLQVIGFIPRNIEKHLHKKFSHLNIKREWFRPDQSLMDFIENNCVFLASQKLKAQGKVLTTTQMCQELKVSRMTVHRMRKNRELPPVIESSRRIVRWRRSDVELWHEMDCPKEDEFLALVKTKHQFSKGRP